MRWSDERELRGVGLVETLDAEWVASDEGKGLFPDRPAPVNNERSQPPVLTKAWYHLGIPRHDHKLEAAYGREQWSPVAGAPDPRRLPGPVFADSWRDKGRPGERIRRLLLRAAVHANRNLVASAARSGREGRFPKARIRGR